MDSFDFDGANNVISTKIPSVKSINRMFCKKKGAAGLWIAHENIIACGWKKNCSKNCEDNCVDHFVNTGIHNIQTPDDEILGCGIINPRIIVLRRSPLLKLSVDKGQYLGHWVKNDKFEKDDKGFRKYVCARRYLVLFLDDNNKPLHTEPIQLTAKGVFQYEFDKNLMNFRTEIQNSYAKSMKTKSGNMKELWYAMCVFVPNFDSKLVGTAPAQSNACVVSSYEIPTENNWISLCVGRDKETNFFVKSCYDNTENWINKYKNATKISSPTSEVGDFNDDYSCSELNY